MKGKEFERKIKRIGRKHGVAVRFEKGRGKGSHGRLYYGQKYTTLKDRKKELGLGLVLAMLEQLGLTKQDLEEA